MTNKLQGKVALITGASAGIGQACARALAGEGNFGFGYFLEEDDARIYGDYADRLKTNYPDTVKMLKIMQDEMTMSERA